MKGSQTQLTFRKTGACPTAATLVGYRSDKLSPEIAALVGAHLQGCEFCNAELRLLAHHKARRGRHATPPEIPINLRILAESLLSRKD
jgi:hypothetical protein